MTWQAWATVAVVVGAMALFASEKLRIDLVALVVLGTLVVLGIVTPVEALSGFSNEATVTVAAMFALSLGIERSGVLDPLTRLLMRIRKPWLLTLAMMLAIAPLGAFVKNIALVATFLPLALRVCQRTGTSPAGVLMPMAYAAQMGGVCTLIGTSSNLLTDSLAQQNGLAAFGVFEFTRLGVLLAVVGIAYLMLIGRHLLPKEIPADLPQSTDAGKYVTELEVVDGSPLLGTRIAEARLGDQYGVYPLELLRGDQRMWTPREQELKAGDVLLVRGDWEKIEEFRRRAKLRNAPERRYTEADDQHRRLIAEVMVAPASPLEGQRISDIGLDWRYRSTVLAVHRRGQVLRDKISEIQLAVGDVLLILVEDESAMPELRKNDAFIVLSEREDVRGMSRKAWLAASIMAGVVIVSGLHWLPIPMAAICGAIIMALTGCFGRKDVYEAMDWKIIVLLGAILPLGIAIEKTGLSAVLVDEAMRLVGGHGPLAALLVVYLLTALLTELMGHNPSVVLMVGIAVSIGHAMGVDPRPFVVAVAFAAATSFATPVGYPTNTMVYYAGGYRFTDFMKVGIPLIAIFCALSMWLIPIFWPFHP
ncbi:MAG: SLC13 family permease [Xanthomonadales bacterium]|nr:SLC13 family permease [Xanthomonadales bacterium]